MDFIEYNQLVSSMKQWIKSYSNGTPDVSDKVFDDSLVKLRHFELENPDMVDKTSPTFHVNSDLKDGFQKVDHVVPMLSIAKSQGFDELRTWVTSMQRKNVDGQILNCEEQVVEFKIDGLALGLRYKDGYLVDAVTRGNGTTGDSVVANAMQISNIPKTIPYKGIVEIRGEVVWFMDSFNKYNEYLDSIGKNLLSNPRNGAAGTMKSHDPKEVAERNLTFITYSIPPKYMLHDTHMEDMNYLKSIGFSIADSKLCVGIESVMSECQTKEVEKSSLPYLTDGLVIKVNNKKLYSTLGGTATSPHAFTALKFPPEEKVTKILSIEESYGRSGAVTPVAIVETIDLSLTKVSRASLHNWDMVDYLGLHVGCSVVIRKANEIIPEIVNVVETGRSKDVYETTMHSQLQLDEAKAELIAKYPTFNWYSRPSKCKHCDSELSNAENLSGDQLVSWVCPNPDCSIKSYMKIVRFVSKEAMNIMGIGESLVESMLSYGLIRDYTDLYNLTVKDLLKIDGIKVKSAEKYIDVINDSRKTFLNNLLVGLGITNLGRSASVILADTFKTLSAIRTLAPRELASVAGIGDELSVNISEWMSTHRATLDYFIDNNIAVNAKPSLKTSDVLSGQTFIMTGSFPDLDRNVFKDLVVEHGGKIVSSISKKTQFILVGSGAGPAKIQEINKLQSAGVDIKVIDDKQFLKMIGK